MNLIRTMDALLREPGSVYRAAAEGASQTRLCVRLLLIFVLTSGLYGAAMGGFRWLHPQFLFSDFTLLSDGGAQATGSVAGMDPATGTVYTAGSIQVAHTPTHVTFNSTHPSEAYKVTGLGLDRGYIGIRLAPGQPLQEPDTWRLPLLVAGKVPLLFLITLATCALALYALNLGLGVRLGLVPVMTTCAFGLAATGVMLAVLAPIAVLFSVVTENYHFMKLFHLGAFAFAGTFGLITLHRGLRQLAGENWPRVKALVVAWLLLYGLVGGQVAWSLKPYLGTPYLPATPPFRVEVGNIYVSALESATRVALPRPALSIGASAPLPQAPAPAGVPAGGTKRTADAGSGGRGLGCR